MKKEELINKIGKKANRLKLKLIKNRPGIMIAAGGVGVVVSTVAACRATLMLDAVLDEPRKDLERLHYYKENMDAPELGGKYTEDNLNRDITVTYAKMVVNVAKLYGPAAVGMGLSLGAIAGGAVEYHNRNVELAALAANLKTAFSNYRKRTRDRFGDEVDKELRYGIVDKEFEETTVDKKGKEKTVKKKVPIAEGLDDISIYAKFYDDCCTGYTKDPEKNLLVLKRMEDTATEKLRKRGHLFLNEVYDMLNIPRTTIGQKVGWIFDEDNPIGDNYVDFGIYNLNHEKNRDFVNGYESVILLDFNVDGEIIDMI